MNKAHLPQAGSTLEIEDVLARDARTRDIHADVVFMPDTHLTGERQIQEHAHEHR
ncbi:hypothetical protein ATER59S_00248 [Aquamicrobium terrae]